MLLRSFEDLALLRPRSAELSEATLVPENKLAAIKFAPEVTSYKVTSPEVTSAAEPSSTPRPQRLREPSAKALEAIATYNIQEQIEDEGLKTSFALKILIQGSALTILKVLCLLRFLISFRGYVQRQ